MSDAHEGEREGPCEEGDARVDDGELLLCFLDGHRDRHSLHVETFEAVTDLDLGRCERWGESARAFRATARMTTTARRTHILLAP